MIKWPVKLRNGREAGKLPGIGPSISAKLDEKLRLYQIESGVVSEIPDGAIIFDEIEVAESVRVKQRQKQKKDKVAKDYVPTYRSAPYAVLLALLLHLHQDPQNGPISKSELIMKAQCYSTSPLNDGMFPSINGALKTLEDKELIDKLGNPAHFILTLKGAELASKLWQKGENNNHGNGHVLLPPLNPLRLFNSDKARNSESNKSESSSSSSSSLKELEVFTWPVGSFEIVLLIDVREIRSREDRNYLSERLGQLGIQSEVRNLELGDFIWVARKRRNTGDNNNLLQWTDTEEIVLDTLIERKREDDLIASITDGRFKEQKHRISRSLLSSTFYLVERGGGAAAHEFLGGGEERLLSATLQCQVIDGLMYRQTGGLDESIVFLAALHRQLERRFGKDQIIGCALKACDFNYKTFPVQFTELQQRDKIFMNYTAYALLNSKSTNQSASDLFLLQLMTIKGVTFEKACVILKAFPTPTALHRFYQNLGNDLAREDAFKEFGNDRDDKGKRFGPALSKKIYEVFGRRAR